MPGCVMVIREIVGKSFFLFSFHQDLDGKGMEAALLDVFVLGGRL